MGKFTKRLVTGAAAVLAMAVGASAQPGILIDNFESGSNENYMGHYWYFYTNTGVKGGQAVAADPPRPALPDNSVVLEWNNGALVSRNIRGCASDSREQITIDPSQIRGNLGHPNYQLIFMPWDNDRRPGSGVNTAVLEYTNLYGDDEPCYFGVGMGTNLTKAPNPDKPVTAPGGDNPPQLPVGNIFNNVTHIGFYAKVSHASMTNGVVGFKVETAEQLRHVDQPGATVGTLANSKKLAEAALYAPLKFTEHGVWQKFQIAVTGACNYTAGAGSNPRPAGTTATSQCVGDIIRPGWETSQHHDFVFDIKDAVKIAWFIQGGTTGAPTAGATHRLVIDSVHTIGGNYTRPGLCPDCRVSANRPTSGAWLLSDFDNILYEDPDPEVYGYISQNRLGGPWYAFDDAADAVNAGATPSEIIMGLWNDPQYLVYPAGHAQAGQRCPVGNAVCVQGGAGLNIEAIDNEYTIGEPMEGKKGHSNTNGAFIGFNMGSGWNDPDGENIRGFVGIGTELAPTKGGFFNANTGITAAHLPEPSELSGKVEGIYFMYRTIGMGTLVISVIDSAALARTTEADATYSVKVPGTDGAWAAARIPWDKFAVPGWSSWTRPLDLTKIAELQFRHEANQGMGSIAIDNVYFYGTGFTVGVQTLRSKVNSATAMRATYSRGSINVNWNAPSQISSGKISLVNIKGVTVASQSVKASGSNVAAKLSTKGALPTGMYFVRIDARDVNGKRVVQQVPVNIVK